MTNCDGKQTEVSLSVELADPGWSAFMGDGEAQIYALFQAVLGHVPDGPEGFSLAQGLTVILTDDAAVHTLNRTYRNADKPTNVLTFRTPMAPIAQSPVGTSQDGPWAGDIFLARQTVEKEAAEQGKTPYHHACHLIVHGFLHLIGYDHQTEADAHAMESCEVAVLHDLGIADPYRYPRDKAGNSAE